MRQRLDHRAVAEAMDAEDARDYLLDVIERERPSGRYLGEPWPGVRLTPMQGRILSAIAAGKGKSVSHEAIMSAMYFDRLEADYPGLPEKTRHQLITKLRHKLPSGVRIVNLWRWGYRLEVDPGTPWPWSDAS